MKFVCDRCQTRYSIADEKVRQKILRIRCKTCANVIVVQDERLASSAASSSSSMPRSFRLAATGSNGGEHGGVNPVANMVVGFHF